MVNVDNNLENKIKISNLNIWYDSVQALKNLSLEVKKNEILGVIGPSNSGKTSFLRALNRMNELQLDSKTEGKIYWNDKNVLDININFLRRMIGIVFALPLPLPMSIYENVSYGPRMHGVRNKTKLLNIVEKALRASALWDEVKDRLNTSAFKLSGGQQQRLCIARTLAVEPEVILYDEPCSGLDPISTHKVEEAMLELKNNYTQILVTNNVKQAARVSTRTAFFLMGEMIEIGETGQVFTTPKDKRTEDYITGRFG